MVADDEADASICCSRLLLVLAPLCARTAAGTLRRLRNADCSRANPNEFHVRYINGTNVYIDAGRDAGLAEGTKLVLKQDPSKPATDTANTAIEPGIVAKLTVVAVASTSAVCEVQASARDLVAGDVVSLPDAEVEKIVEKNTLGNTRQYPMVISFTEGDPLDEEVREALPRPPLPEVNQIRGRIGFDVSTHSASSARAAAAPMQYGMVFRADFTRIFGTHWNLNGYWRGNLQHQLRRLTAVPPGPDQSHLSDEPDLRESGLALDRRHRPPLSSLGQQPRSDRWRICWPGSSASHTVTGIFAGSTPDPTAWNYNPQRRIGGVFFNVHGGSFEHFRYSSTAGVGVEHAQVDHQPAICLH